MSHGPRILLHSSETDDLTLWLRQAHPQAEIRCCNDYGGLAAVIADFRPQVVYSVCFAGRDGFPRAALFGADGPQWVANSGAGVDHFETWDPARVTVTNTAGVAADAIGDYVIGGFLHFALDVPGMQRDQVARRWDAGRMVRPLKGRTLVIAGLGHSGQAVAARAKALGMTVLGTRARPEPMRNVDEVHGPDRLHALLGRADFVAVSTPLTPATTGLIGAAEIAAMKPGVILADVSRGGVVDQAALARALVSGHVAAAALDVFETEPLPADSPLWDMENVLVSPHCSAVHADWEKASFEMFLANLGRWLRGEALRNIVDPARGY